MARDRIRPAANALFAGLVVGMLLALLGSAVLGAGTLLWLATGGKW